MKKHIGRIIFFLALIVFVIYVEWAWFVAKGKALSQGISESEFAKNELANISPWEWPLLIIFAAAPVVVIAYLIIRRVKKNKRNARTEKADLRS